MNTDKLLFPFGLDALNDESLSHIIHLEQRRMDAMLAWEAWGVTDIPLTMRAVEYAYSKIEEDVAKTGYAIGSAMFFHQLINFANQSLQSDS